MDDQNLSIFENRSDDWLAKERAYEETVSAWDFDEGKKIKKAHEIRHEIYNKTHEKGLITELPKVNHANSQFTDLTKFNPANSKGIATIAAMMFIFVFVILMVIGAASGIIELGEIPFAIPIIIFIIISLSIGKKGGNKK